MAYYVYRLIDPRDNLPFYVGKGIGRRILSHEKEAKEGVCSPKCDRIRAIVGAGFKIRREFVQEFDDEKAAYDLESKLINTTPGLTNAQRVETDPLRKTYKSHSFMRIAAIALQLMAGYRYDCRGKPWKAALQDAMIKKGDTFVKLALTKLTKEEVRDGLKPFGINVTWQQD